MTKKIIFAIIFLSSGLLFAEKSISIPGHDEIQKLYAAEHLNYSPQERSTFIESINRKIIDFFRNLFRKLSSGEGYEIKDVYLAIIAVIIASAVLFLLYKILKGVWFFYSPGKKVNIHNPSHDLEVKKDTDYINLYQNALEIEDPDTAIRYLYLHALKELSNRSIIFLRKDKTNKMYASEIKDMQIRNTFIKIANMFNFVYYGKNHSSMQQALDIKHLCDLMTEAET